MISPFPPFYYKTRIGMHILILSFQLLSFVPFVTGGQEGGQIGAKEETHQQCLHGQIAPPGHYRLLLWDTLKGDQENTVAECKANIFDEDSAKFLSPPPHRSDIPCFGHLLAVETDANGHFGLDREWLERAQSEQSLVEKALQLIGAHTFREHIVPLDEHSNPIPSSENAKFVVQSEVDKTDLQRCLRNEECAFEFHAAEKRSAILEEALQKWKSGQLGSEQKFFIGAYMRQMVQQSGTAVEGAIRAQFKQAEYPVLPKDVEAFVGLFAKYLPERSGMRVQIGSQFNAFVSDFCALRTDFGLYFGAKGKNEFALEEWDRRICSEFDTMNAEKLAKAEKTHKEMAEKAAKMDRHKQNLARKKQQRMAKIGVA